MSRPSIMVIAAGSAALLVALVVLYRSTRSDAVPLSPMTPIANDRTAPPSAAPAPAAPAVPDRVAPAKPSAAPAVAAPTAPRIDSVLPGPAAEPAPAMTNDGLQFGAPQLKVQMREVEPLVRECVDKAAITGDRSTGNAVLTYIVAQRGDKFVVEDTGIESDKTTIENQPLLDCLHLTAKAMKFEGLPRGAKELYVTRKVELEGGKLTNYVHLSFSYLR